MNIIIRGDFGHVHFLKKLKHGEEKIYNITQFYNNGYKNGKCRIIDGIFIYEFIYSNGKILNVYKCYKNGILINKFDIVMPPNDEEVHTLEKFINDMGNKIYSCSIQIDGFLYQNITNILISKLLS